MRYFNCREYIKVTEYEKCKLEKLLIDLPIKIDYQDIGNEIVVVGADLNDDHDLEILLDLCHARMHTEAFADVGYMTSFQREIAEEQYLRNIVDETHDDVRIFTERGKLKVHYKSGEKEITALVKFYE
jgi:hypothetical protein